jgi:putative transposase
MSSYIVRKLKLEKTEQLDQLSRAAGDLYSRTLVDFWRTVRKKGIWLKPSSLMRWHNSDQVHAHSADAVVQAFFAALKSWRQLRKSSSDAKPLKRRRFCYRVQWKSSAIRVRDGKLLLSNGKGNDPLVLNWSWEVPKLIEIGWDGRQYELRAVYKTEPIAQPIGEKVAAVDMGEIHIAVAHDGESTDILNGRLLRSKRQYQNKLKAELSSLIDKKKRGSKRRKRLIRSKSRQLQTLQHQINDILHKQTSKLVYMLHARGVKTLVIGDVRDIRKSIDYGKKANQKLHQWSHGATRQMLTYKAEKLGIEVVLESERYTSQTCPACGKRHKPKGREYRCKCGFQFHRDGVGAVNIRKKYLGCMDVPVVGVMASPVGVRFNPQLRRSIARSLESGSERIPCL